MQSRELGYLGAGCAAVLLVLMVSMCGLAALVRQYREITVPLSLVFLVLGVFVARDAYARLRRRG